MPPRKRKQEQEEEEEEKSLQSEGEEEQDEDEQEDGGEEEEEDEEGKKKPKKKPGRKRGSKKEKNNLGDYVVSDVECKIEQMWVDQLRPHEFDDLTFHDDINRRLQQLVSTSHARRSLPHLLFYGPSGGGKRTRVQCLLNALYRLTGEQFEASQFGAKERNAKPKTRVRESDGTLSAIEELTHPRRFILKMKNASQGAVCEIFVFRSPYHMELTPSDLGRNDMHVVQQALKAFVQSGEQTMQTFVRNYEARTADEEKTGVEEGDKRADANAAQNRVASMFGIVKKQTVDDVAKEKKDAQKETKKYDNPPFRVVVVNQADRLTHQAQAALRRTIEAYTEHIRFILIAERIEGVIDPIQSRCLPFRVPLVSSSESSAAEDTEGKSASKNDKDSEMERILRLSLRQNMSVGNSPHRLKEFIHLVAQRSYGDLTRAMLLLQCSVTNLPDYKTVQHISPEKDLLDADWIDTIRDIVLAITTPSYVTAAHTSAARALMRDLQTHCIPSRQIISTMIVFLIERLSPASATTNEKRTVSPLLADIMWLAAEYERRCALSHFYVIHLDTLLSQIILALALHQRGQQYTLDGDSINAGYRAYDTVEPASRRMLHTRRACAMQTFETAAARASKRPLNEEKKKESRSSRGNQKKDEDRDGEFAEKPTDKDDIWSEIWSISNSADLNELRSLVVAE